MCAFCVYKLISFGEFYEVENYNVLCYSIEIYLSIFSTFGWTIKQIFNSQNRISKLFSLALMIFDSASLRRISSKLDLIIFDIRFFSSNICLILHIRTNIFIWLFLNITSSLICKNKSLKNFKGILACRAFPIKTNGTKTF